MNAEHYGRKRGVRKFGFFLKCKQLFTFKSTKDIDSILEKCYNIFFYLFDYLCLLSKTSHLKNSQLLKNIDIIFGAVSFSGYENNSFVLFLLWNAKRFILNFNYIASYLHITF